MTLLSGLDAELQQRRCVVVGRNDDDNSRELRALKVRNELADILELSQSLKQILNVLKKFHFKFQNFFQCTNVWFICLHQAIDVSKRRPQMSMIGAPPRNVENVRVRCFQRTISKCLTKFRSFFLLIEFKYVLAECRIRFYGKQNSDRFLSPPAFFFSVRPNGHFFQLRLPSSDVTLNKVTASSFPANLDVLIVLRRKLVIFS